MSQLKFEDIPAMMITLPEDQGWMNQMRERLPYFAANGFPNILQVPGVHCFNWGLRGTHIYLRDNPQEQHYIGDKKTGGFLSWHIAIAMMRVMPQSHTFYLEADCEFVEGFKEKAQQALNDVPDDFDFLFIGSCCAKDKPKKKIKNNIYEVHYPLCGHCYIIAKKCTDFIIATNRDTSDPIDISLMHKSFPSLKIYTVLPRLVSQHQINLAE